MKSKWRCDNRIGTKKKPIFQYICYDDQERIEMMTDTLDEMGRYLGITEAAVYRAMKEHRSRIGKPKRTREIVRISMAELEGA